MFKLFKNNSQKVYPYYQPINKELQHKMKDSKTKYFLRDIQINQRNNKNGSLFQKKSQKQGYNQQKFKWMEKERISKNTKYQFEQKSFLLGNQNVRKRSFRKILNGDYLNYIAQKNDKKYEQPIKAKRVMLQILKSSNCKAGKYKAEAKPFDHINRNIIIKQQSNTILGSSIEHSLINHKSLIKQSQIKYHKSNSAHIELYVESSSDSDEDQQQLKDKNKQIAVSYDQSLKSKKRTVNFKQKCNNLLQKIEPTQINHNDILTITVPSIKRENKQMVKHRYLPKFNNHYKKKMLNTQSLIEYQSPQNQLR